MDFNVQYMMGKYLELRVQEDGATIVTGMLDKQEAKELGEKLLRAAVELMTKQDMSELLKDNFDKEDLFGEDDD